MARLAYELRSMMPARQLREIRVDSIVFQPGRKAAEVVKRIDGTQHVFFTQRSGGRGQQHHEKIPGLASSIRSLLLSEPILFETTNRVVVVKSRVAPSVIRVVRTRTAATFGPLDVVLQVAKRATTAA